MFMVTFPGRFPSVNRRPASSPAVRSWLIAFLSAVPAVLALLAPVVSTGSEPLKIGVLAPLSGPFAAGGASFVQAATLAVEQANAEGGALGRRIEIVVSDTEGRVDIARTETLRLISRDKVDALVGAYLSEETMGVMETAGARKTLLIVPIAATAEVTDRIRRERAKYRNVFRVSYSIPQWAETLAAFLKGRRTVRYAFVGTGIRWNRELGDALEKASARLGIGVSYTGYYSPGNPAFDPVAVAASGSGADIVVLGDPGRNSLTFLKRFRELSPALPVLSVGGTLGDARLLPSLPLTGPLYVQAAAWKGSTPSATSYAERFEKRFGSAPVGYSDTLPHDAVTVLVAAWRRAGSAEWTAVADALEKGTFQGASGSYRFDDSHQAIWGAGTGALHGTIIRWERDGGRIVFPPR
jgi:branched-chain amino acid transport system substrate-binding protein